MKITVIPWMVGAIGVWFFLGDFSFAIDSGLIMLVLFTTKQVKLI